jgi:hypothetical protein
MRIACAVLFLAAATTTSWADEKALEPLVKELGAKSEKSRLSAIEKLAALGEGAKPALKDVCDRLLDPSTKVSTAALVAIERIDPKLYKPLREYLLGKGGVEAMRNLAALGDQLKPARTLLFTHLRQELAQTRPRPNALAICEAIGAAQFDDDEAIKTIAALAKMPLVAPSKKKGRDTPSGTATECRRWAIGHLVKWASDDKERLKVVVPIVKAGIDEPRLAIDCIQIAGSMGKSAADLLPQLRDLKLSSNPQIRKAADEAVAKIEK